MKENRYLTYEFGEMLLRYKHYLINEDKNIVLNITNIGILMLSVKEIKYYQDWYNNI
jgi:hypothetical protein